MQQFAALKQHLVTTLPHMSADRCHLLIVNGQVVDGIMSYTVRLLLLDYKFAPLQVLSQIRKWLKDNNRLLDLAGKEVQLSFSSEVIDHETFDLEIDFPQSDKVILEGDDFHICGRMVWDEALMIFVRL